MCEKEIRTVPKHHKTLLLLSSFSLKYEVSPLTATFFLSKQDDS